MPAKLAAKYAVNANNKVALRGGKATSSGLPPKAPKGNFSRGKKATQSGKTPSKLKRRKPVVDQLDEATVKEMLKKALKTKAVGYGAFAKVYRVTYKGTICAMKVGTPEADEFGDTGEDMLQHEIARLLAAQGVKHCIRCLGYYKRQKGSSTPPVVLLQWAPMDLCDDASEFTKLELLKIWKQVFIALQEVHKKQVHFDVKPENILLDDKKNAYLADFGLAESLHTSRKTKGHEASGSPGFEAPEVRKGAILPLGHQAHKVDIWSAGVSVLQGMKFVDNKFAKVHKVALDRLDNGKDVNMDKHLLVEDEEVRRFIEKTMHPNPRRRCTARAAAEMLQNLMDRDVSWC